MIQALERPYPGTRPFQQTDRGWFFGRAADVAALAERWQANRLTVVVGPVAFFHPAGFLTARRSLSPRFLSTTPTASRCCGLGHRVRRPPGWQALAFTSSYAIVPSGMTAPSSQLSTMSKNYSRTQGPAGHTGGVFSMSSLRRWRGSRAYTCCCWSARKPSA